MKIITFGTFDLLHIGHINILESCKNFDNKDNELIVGISSDNFSYKKKIDTLFIHKNKEKKY